jgi:DNA-binding PadR family transcriptional regulator
MPEVRYLYQQGIGDAVQLPKDLMAASATPLVLSLLQRGDSYGYEIIRRVRELSDGELEWKEGMLYPLLHRLDERGLIEAYEHEADSGRPRRYYRLLPEGRRQLDDQRAGFAVINSLLSSLGNRELGGSHA